MLQSKHLILIKIEGGGYGVDAVPVVGTDAALVSDLDIQPGGSANERNPASASLSPWRPGKPNLGPITVKFSAEYKGSGTANIAPEMGPALRAAGMAQSILAGPNRVEYDPISSGFPSVTIYAYLDGLFHKVMGCVGNVELVLEAGKQGMWHFTFQGLYTIPTDGAIPAGAVYHTTVAPIVESVNLTIGGYAALFSKFQFSPNNVISKRTSGNAPFGLFGLQITGRKPAGSVDPEAVTRATHDFFQLMQDATPQAISCVVGTSAGNRLTFTGPQVIYDPFAWGVRDEARTFDVPLRFVRNAGDDEFKIKSD